MRAAVEFELLKAGRAPVFRWGAVTVVLGVPGIPLVFFVLVRSGGASPAVAKAMALLTDPGLAGLVAVAGQVLTVAVLMTAGIAASWSFGREFVDDAVPALFAVATSRRSVAGAKFLVLTGWAAVTTVVAVVVTVLAGLALGLPLTSAALTIALQAGVAGLLSALLAWPLALVASWRRGYLAGFVALILVVVLTQLLTATGAGAWFPYAAPSLWMGLGGPEAAAKVTATQLALAPLVSAAAVAGTLAWWGHAEAR
jgi:ABC-2 type transport system permease protein